MKKQDTIGSVIYHFFFALTSGVMGAIVASWPLLFFFMAIEKTNETVGMSLFKVMGNYNQLMGYLLLPWHRQLKMADFPTSANAAAHFAEVKGLFQLTALVFLLCLALHFYFQQAKRKPYLGMSQVAALIFMVLPVVVLPDPGMPMRTRLSVVARMSCSIFAMASSGISLSWKSSLAK